MEKELIFATTNEGKMKEIRMILSDLNCKIVSLKEKGIQTIIEETGTTFEENAILKAKQIMELTKQIVLADDSGLEIDCLDKAPGVYSARFLGEDTPYSIKNKYIIEQLEQLGAVGDQRSARFVCAIACAYPDGKIETTYAAIEGLIHDKEEGTNGFGYDPIFYVPQFNCTSAQLSAQQKNQISHRGKALQEMKEKLKKFLA